MSNAKHPQFNQICQGKTHLLYETLVMFEFARIHHTFRIEARVCTYDGLKKAN